MSTAGNPASTSGSAELGAIVGGYRVVRRLGASERADVYLGVLTGSFEDDAAEVSTRTPVALKIYHLKTAGAVIEREIRVMTETTGARFAKLIDFATLSDGRVCIVQEHLAGGRLSRLIGDGRSLTPGETVTILAPILAALAQLLALGYVHEGLGQSSVIFDRSGRPVLTALGRLRELPPAGSERSNVVEEAARRVTAFALGVLDRVEPSWDAAVPDPAAWLESIPPGMALRSLLDELERRLFAWAPASAVVMSVAPWVPSAGRRPEREGGWAQTEALRGGRAAAPGPGFSLLRAKRQRRSSGRVRKSGRSWTLLSELRTLLHGLTSRPAGALLTVQLPEQLRDRMARWLRVHRGPLLASSLVSTAVCVLLLTFGYQPEARGGNAGPASGVVPPVAPGTASSSAAPRPASPGPITNPGNAAADRAAVEADEPVLAVRVLLRLRAGCLTAVSVACLDGTDQPGSAALASDGQAIKETHQGAQAAPAREAARSAPSLVERRGDVALVAVVLTDASTNGDSKPASILVVKGEAGWRIRQIFEY
ncbi:hypothetical protein E3O19_13670 [Cryobacterium algoritolerans]|uniref:Protein kinase domain-containing protein n=1 Tax=Cryobacterium algoritolerans TaxID=1259184 RepID=A0A4R8WNT8_9MICO|nr:protein kinase [Cryobacterium algoritolerans]TFC12271.1 hypothetical protein E3O19_13670 [Cryobacterium algoritolerans]